MIDYLVDPITFDLQIANGDFVKGDSTQQNQNALLYAQPGEYKQFPTAGVGLFKYLKSNDNGAALMRAIRQQFTQDGMQVSSLGIVNGDIQVVAPYANS
jgi:hypothetical protein